LLNVSENSNLLSVRKEIFWGKRSKFLWLIFYSCERENCHDLENKKITSFIYKSKIGQSKFFNVLDNNTGVQGKNNAYQNVNRFQILGIYEWILNLIDIVVCAVFALTPQ
jgi:hypothetical protein